MQPQPQLPVHHPTTSASLGYDIPTNTRNISLSTASSNSNISGGVVNAPITIENNSAIGAQNGISLATMSNTGGISRSTNSGPINGAPHGSSNSRSAAIWAIPPPSQPAPLHLPPETLASPGSTIKFGPRPVGSLSVHIDTFGDPHSRPRAHTDAAPPSSSSATVFDASNVKREPHQKPSPVIIKKNPSQNQGYVFHASQSITSPLSRHISLSQRSGSTGSNEAINTPSSSSGAGYDSVASVQSTSASKSIQRNNTSSPAANISVAIGNSNSNVQKNPSTGSGSPVTPTSFAGKIMHIFTKRSNSKHKHENSATSPNVDTNLSEASDPANVDFYSDLDDHQLRANKSPKSEGSPLHSDMIGAFSSSLVASGNSSPTKASPTANSMLKNQSQNRPSRSESQSSGLREHSPLSGSPAARLQLWGLSNQASLLEPNLSKPLPLEPSSSPVSTLPRMPSTQHAKPQQSQVELTSQINQQQNIAQSKQQKAVYHSPTLSLPSQPQQQQTNLQTQMPQTLSLQSKAEPPPRYQSLKAQLPKATTFANIVDSIPDSQIPTTHSIYADKDPKKSVFQISLESKSNLDRSKYAGSDGCLSEIAEPKRLASFCRRKSLRRSNMIAENKALASALSQNPASTTPETGNIGTKRGKRMSMSQTPNASRRSKFLNQRASAMVSNSRRHPLIESGFEDEYGRPSPNVIMNNLEKFFPGIDHIQVDIIGDGSGENEIETGSLTSLIASDLDLVQDGADGLVSEASETAPGETGSELRRGSTGGSRTSLRLLHGAGLGRSRESLHQPLSRKSPHSSASSLSEILQSFSASNHGDPVLKPSFSSTIDGTKRLTLMVRKSQEFATQTTDLGDSSKQDTPPPMGSPSGWRSGPESSDMAGASAAASNSSIIATSKSIDRVMSTHERPKSSAVLSTDAHKRSTMAPRPKSVINSLLAITLKDVAMQAIVDGKQRDADEATKMTGRPLSYMAIVGAAGSSSAPSTKIDSNSSIGSTPVATATGLISNARPPDTFKTHSDTTSKLTLSANLLSTATDMNSTVPNKPNANAPGLGGHTRSSSTANAIHALDTLLGDAALFETLDEDDASDSPAQKSAWGDDVLKSVNLLSNDKNRPRSVLQKQQQQQQVSSPQTSPPQTGSKEKAMAEQIRRASVRNSILKTPEAVALTDLGMISGADKRAAMSSLQLLGLAEQTRTAMVNALGANTGMATTTSAMTAQPRIEGSQRLSFKPGDRQRMSKTNAIQASTAQTNMHVSCINTQTNEKIVWISGGCIGAGAHASVYLGLNIKTGKWMAVKQVRTVLASTDGSGPGGRRQSTQRARFGAGRKQSVYSPMMALSRELELLQSLKHPHIVEYLGFEQTIETTNIFLEYVSGGSIWSMLGKTGPFPEPAIWALSAQMLDGLDYLHSQGILHRDIKALNVLMDIINGWAKISDFGVSKRLTTGNAYKRISDAVTQGTARWMAPENVRSKGYSAKIDIWSFGCVIIEMKTAKVPWMGLDADLQIYSQLAKNKAPPLPQNLSPELTAFITRCFIIDPDQRPTARNLLSDPGIKHIDPYGFPFESYYKEASEAYKKMRELEDQQASDDDDDDDDDEADEDDEDDDDVQSD